MKNYLNNNFDFTQLVDVFDELPIWSAPFGLKLLDYIDYKTNIKALDIGFGTGFPITEIAMRLGDTCKIYGIDPWTDAIQRLNKKIGYYGIKNIEIFNGVAESIPLESNSIDLIVSNNGLNNVNDLGKAISECSRIIKQNRQFVQTLNLDQSMFEFYNQFKIVLKDLKLDNEIDKVNKHIYEKRRPVDEITRILNQSGFEIKDLEHFQFNYKFANGTAMLNHYFIRLAFMDSWIKILPQDKIEQVFDLVEQRLNEHSDLMSGLKLSIPFVVINTRKK